MKIYKTANYQKIAQRQMRNTFSPGDKVRITDGSGIDSNKVVTVVSPNYIKTDGSGVPTNVQGAYKPVDWSKEVAFQYDDGSFGTMFKNRLIKVDKNDEKAMREYEDQGQAALWRAEGHIDNR